MSGGLQRIVLALGAAAALFAGGMMGGAALAKTVRKYPHELFTEEDRRQCAAANGVLFAALSGPEAKHYEHYFEEFFRISPGMTSKEWLMRLRVSREQVSREELRAFADNCIKTLQQIETPDDRKASKAKPFRNTLSKKLLTPELKAQLAADARAAAPPPVQSSYSGPGPTFAQPQANPLTGRCDAILEKGVKRARAEMNAARRAVEAWIRAGSYGVAFGGAAVQSGCRAIRSTYSDLQAAGCPANYTNALQGFYNDYYIVLPGGSRFDCSQS